jgi:hypothetical protein
MASLNRSGAQLHAMDATVQKARALVAQGESSAKEAGHTEAFAEASRWPLRDQLDDLIREAGGAAHAHGVAVRTMSVSHTPTSAQAWGRVALDVSASGSYAALKTWQAAMQQGFPALSVQSLRLQGNTPNMAGLEAHAIWVLHVRD